MPTIITGVVACCLLHQTVAFSCLHHNVGIPGRMVQRRELLSLSVSSGSVEQEEMTTMSQQLEIKDEAGDDDDMIIDYTNLPPLADPTADPSDDLFRSIRRDWPVPFIHFLRDTGVVRFLQDALFVLVLIPYILSEYPTALSRYLQLPVEKIRYGNHPSQVIDLLHPPAQQNNNNKMKNNKKTKGLLVFCHGGAWGSGRPWMYRLVGECFLRANYSVAVWGYRTYPDGRLPEQTQDLHDALSLLRNRHNNNNDDDDCPITVMGHSSGAHVAVLAALQSSSSSFSSTSTTTTNNNKDNTDGRPLCDNLILLNGIYDLSRHYEWETARGVEEISGLKPVSGNNDRQEWVRNSPTRIVQNCTEPLSSSSFPSILIVHGGNDTTVPYTTAVNLTKALYKNNPEHFSKAGSCRLELLPTTGHADTVIDLMMGGPTQDVVLDWMEGQQQQRRRQC